MAERQRMANKSRVAANFCVAHISLILQFFFQSEFRVSARYDHLRLAIESRGMQLALAEKMHVTT